MGDHDSLIELNKTISSLELKHVSLEKDFVHSEIRQKELIEFYKVLDGKQEEFIDDIRKEIDELKTRIEKLNNNAFLNFTSEITFKKIFVIFFTSISLLSSAGLLDNFVNSLTEKETQDKVERILTILENE